MPVPAHGNGRARAGRTRARRSLFEGGDVSPRARRSPLEGGVCPRARRSLLEGIFEWPPWWVVGATGTWAMPCVFKRDMFSLGFLQVLSGVSQLFKGTPGLSPTDTFGPDSTESQSDLVFFGVG
jgi:hypothetical protein